MLGTTRHAAEAGLSMPQPRWPDAAACVTARERGVIAGLAHDPCLGTWRECARDPWLEHCRGIVEETGCEAVTTR